MREVTECGLFIDTKFGYLGASPDGVIENEGAIVEVKYVLSAVETGLYNKAVSKKPGFFLSS